MAITELERLKRDFLEHVEIEKEIVLKQLKIMTDILIDFFLQTFKHQNRLQMILCENFA